jgi:hypothetical protein
LSTNAPVSNQASYEINQLPIMLGSQTFDLSVKFAHVIPIVSLVSPSRAVKNDGTSHNTGLDARALHVHCYFFEINYSNHEVNL